MEAGEIIEQIALAVIAGGATQGLAGIVRHATAGDAAYKSTVAVLRKDVAWCSVLSEAARAHAGDSTALRAFLESPEYANVVRQVANVFALKSDIDDLALGQIEAEVAAFLVLQSRTMGPDTATALARALTRSTVEGIATAIGSIGRSRRFAGLVNKPANHTEILAEQLSAIAKTLQFLANEKAIDYAEITEFERRLRENVRGRHGWIYPPHVGVARRVPIDDLYVAPDLTVVSLDGEHPQKAVSLVDFVRVIKRSVLLGTPGGGKSTLSAKVAFDLASTETTAASVSRITPLVVVMREYGAARESKRLGIHQYLESVCTVEYQLEPPRGAIEYLLLSGRAMIIFDGLDELLETRFRREISKDVELFSTRYPTTPVLVTSREIGYAEAPLDETRYETWRLAPFDDDKVALYAQKWFAADVDLPVEERTKKARAFVRESRVARDLRTNPLMLALMCNIYRGENYIPANRPDLYDKCANLLFETWDRQRDIRVNLPFQSKIRPAMAYLAHAMYGDASMQAGVEERRLVDMAADYLSERLYDDRDEAEAAAREFILFCRGRAWVFTDVGTTPAGDRLYYFAHRTFLEYFTASYLVRTNPSPKALAGVLLPRIEKQEWDVVAQLAFQLLDKNYEGAGDELIGLLLDRSSNATSPESCGNLLAFAARSLSFLVPNTALTQRVAQMSLEFVIQQAAGRQGRRMRARGDARPALGPILQGVTSVSNENRRWVEAVTSGVLGTSIDAEPASRSVAGLQTAVSMSLIANGLFTIAMEMVDTGTNWEQLVGRLFEDHKDRIRQLAMVDTFAAHVGLDAGVVGVKDVVEGLGFKALFEPIYYSGVDLMGGSKAEQILELAASLIWDGTPGNPRQRAQLEDVAHLIVEQPLPWSAGAQFLGAEIPIWTIRPSRRRRSDATPRAWSTAVFVFTALAIPRLETSPTPERALLYLRESGKPEMEIVASVLSAGLNKTKPPGSEVLDRLGLSQPQREWLSGWMAGDFRTTGSHRKGPRGQRRLN